MDRLTARPQLLKQVNLSRIRKTMKDKGTVTRSEIVEETGISSTTVRSLLTEMMQNEEIESIGYDESSGGRKAERYGLKADRYYGVAICMMDNNIHALLVNICEEIVETIFMDVVGENYEQAILPFLDKITSERDIKAIGLGLPGIIEGNGYWRKNNSSGELCHVSIGETLAARYGIPVVLENDLNAITIGFGRCYGKEFPREEPKNINMAYLYFDHGCASAGFITEGRVIRGHNHFAGEIGLIPMQDGTLLDHILAAPMNDADYIKQMIQIISWICGILNPEYVALAGPELRENCISHIGEGLIAFFPSNMRTEILYSKDVWHDYHDGMAHLTAGKIFDVVQLTKE